MDDKKVEECCDMLLKIAEGYSVETLEVALAGFECDCPDLYEKLVEALL